MIEMNATPNTAQTGQISQAQEAIEWLVNDARYLARQSRIYLLRGDSWMADKVRANAAHSLNVAREYKQGVRS
jgi:hypothetical protein